MVSDKYKIATDMENLQPALEIIEKTAAYCGYNKENTLQLRLMGEELLGVLQGLLLSYEGEFWLESSEDTTLLHIEAFSILTATERKKLISLATSGQNTKPKGFLNKLRTLVEAAFYCDQETPPAYFADECSFDRSMGQTHHYGYVWDMRQAMAKGVSNNREEYDELEMSILAKLADNIVVSAYPPHINITISKTFSN